MRSRVGGGSEGGVQKKFWWARGRVGLRWLVRFDSSTARWAGGSRSVCVRCRRVVEMRRKAVMKPRRWRYRSVLLWEDDVKHTTHVS